MGTKSAFATFTDDSLLPLDAGHTGTHVCSVTPWCRENATIAGLRTANHATSNSS